MYAVYKAQAIEMRREGKTYREILAKIPVAKSTLSEWLKSVELAKPQKQRITDLHRQAALRGAQSRKRKRLEEVESLIVSGKLEVAQLSERELWLIGIALYWGEESKQNTRSPSTGIIFGNSDFKMVLVFVAWLKYMKISKTQYIFELYVHKDREIDTPSFIKWWCKVLSIQPAQIVNVYRKNGNPKTRRSNVGDLYHGLIRIRVRSSTILNRQMHGWVEGITAAVGNGVIGNTSAFEAEESRIVP